MTRRRRTVLVALAGGLVAVLMGAGSCDNSPAQESGQKLTEDAFAQQQAAVPYPVADLKEPLERRNVRERLMRTNQPNKVGYVYLLSFSGDPLGYYVIKGKVSSTDSQMTTSNLVIDRTEGDVVVDAPGDDGSYGPNEPGIFFFTAEGAFVTTNLNYLYSDQPLPINAPKLNGK